MIVARLCCGMATNGLSREKRWRNIWIVLTPFEWKTRVGYGIITLPYMRFSKKGVSQWQKSARIIRGAF